MAQERVYMYRLCASEKIDSSQCRWMALSNREGSGHEHFFSSAPCFMSLDPIESHCVRLLAAGLAHLLCLQNDLNKCPLLSVCLCLCRGVRRVFSILTPSSTTSVVADGTGTVA